MAEIIWDGKYKDGKRVAPVKISLPFQTVETVNESAQQRQKSFDLYASGNKTEWRNRLIWGDKKYVLPSLLDEFAGKVNLIYIDPPFDTGADFSFKTKIPESDESFIKEPSIIEQKAYRDTWGRGLDSYLQWFYETASFLRELLADNGSIYVHLDYRVVHYVKAIMDEIFGNDNFLNEIAWCYSEREISKRNYNRKHDTILFYVKNVNNNDRPFNCYEITEEYSILSIKKYSLDDGDGRKYQIRGKGGPFTGKQQLSPEVEKKHPEWTYRDYLDEKLGVLPRDWFTNIDFENRASANRTGYATQKPEKLLDKFIKASTKTGDLVLDCFVGSGTTAAKAEKMGRRWIGCDLGRFAIHTTRKRLLQIDGCKPFVVQNLGKYERQAWRGAEFENVKDVQAKEVAYRKFILDLYHAEPVNGHIWLHGIRAGKMVHVGGVDAPVTFDDVKRICAEVWKAAGKGKDSPKKAAVDILGWDFGFEVNETAKQLAAEAKVQAKFKHIPREVMERQAVDAGDIHFYELAALDVKVSINKKSVAVQLKDFMMPQDDVPEDIRKAVKKWSQWIDYWAIDWDYKDDTFHNMWQSYRTKKAPELQPKITNKYEDKGKYTIVIKVIDILGNDTTKTVDIEIK